MKKNLIIAATGIMIACLATSISLYAQQKASPPKVTQASVNDNKVVINYSSPSKKGREIYGGLVPYDKIWRTGANEATTIELSKDANIGGVDVKAGKYALFTIPGEKEWTIIINSNAKQWGTNSYDKGKDVGRFTVAPSALRNEQESFTIDLNDSGTTTISWDKTMVQFTIK
ncbi:DUF2911 domain-containing protein [Reichenbachiella carrageenanivorans]|uniref:DUF2911 domain-containing protein n=1 Tax=Reichenbachiella carrageenanivorans TaxID=2979869 RepID=A0ABY6D1I9_9BACT|nr:DUF2911 domain-containing protein [Reichenbachiella carrageenanivorans]UXX80016.1 DUF2911 domain-containing protein [Reichenbachiella carrageenanivorans]